MNSARDNLLFLTAKSSLFICLPGLGYQGQLRLDVLMLPFSILFLLLYWGVTSVERFGITFFPTCPERDIRSYQLMDNILPYAIYLSFPVYVT